MSSDTYTVSPSTILPGQGNVTVTYKSANFTNGTTYTLKTLSGTTLASQSITTVTSSSFSGGTSMWAMASDSSGNVYIQSVTSKTVTIYNSGGTIITTIAQSVQFITTCSSADPNLIYWAGSGYFSVLNVSTRTFTNYSSAPDLFGIGYNLSDGYVYGCRVNSLTLYKINPNDGTYTTIFTNSGFPIPGNNGFFEGVTVGGDGNLYCITRNLGSIWKITTSGTSLGLFVALPTDQGVGLVYSSAGDCFMLKY